MELMFRVFWFQLMLPVGLLQGEVALSFQQTIPNGSLCMCWRPASGFHVHCQNDDGGCLYFYFYLRIFPRKCMTHIMFHSRICRFGLLHPFSCYLQNTSPEMVRHDVVLLGSNYLLNYLQLLSQKVASLSLKEMTKLLMKFQFRGSVVTWSPTLTYWQRGLNPRLILENPLRQI